MAKKTSKAKNELAEQTDPRAPLDSAALLAASKPLLAKLEADLLERVKASPSVTAALDVRYQAEKANDRTAESFAGWTSALATQVAAAWLLSCVFVRTLEDRGLLKQNRLAGPGSEDSQRQFFALAPSLTERDYLLAVFRELAHHQAAKELFDAHHSLVWKLSPSAEVAKELLALFRSPTASRPAFRFGQASTRFLGDLYQDLSEDVRKRYALLQTPEFVEAYILDRTLEPAIARFGLDDTTLIDPTCGSGHFLLGAFDRLFENRLRAEPGIDARIAATKALDVVYGADINPYAVAIARFRLTLSFLEKAGCKKLADAPALPLHLVVADSLRINPQHPQQELWQHAGAASATWLGDVFALDDERAAKDVLGRRYAAVVGNPPYITPKDRALRTAYASMYSTCFMNYALTAPFCERIFQLARPRGFTGQITANSFMKRGFGSKLIETFLPTVNLELIVNTSGAYIPGHGTPTVLLFGTNEPPSTSDVLTVLAKRGEPSTPEVPSEGEVWSSIARHTQDVGFENAYISVAHTPRRSLELHPWSLGGGGASELKELLEERAAARLSDVIDDVGFSVIIGEDELFIRPRHRRQWEQLPRMPLVIGEEVRDWSLWPEQDLMSPFKPGGFEVDPDSPLRRELWPWRTILKNRVVSGSTTMEEAKKAWWDVRRLSRDKHSTNNFIAFAFVATHNHFVLDRGGKVFNRSAPIIKLPEGATEDEHLALLAYLNSSTACFWMKQVFFDKGNRGEGGGTTAEAWEKFFEFDGTKLRGLPVPVFKPEDREHAAALSRSLTSLAERARSAADLSALFERASSVSEIEAGVVGATRNYEAALKELRDQQERLDWWIYGLFGLAPRELADAQLGEVRASDFLFARDVAAGGVGERYFTLCRLLPAKEVAQSRASPQHLAAIASSSELALIEQPVYKRTFREGFRPIDPEAQSATWILDRFESVIAGRTEATSVRSALADLVADTHMIALQAWSASRKGSLSEGIVANAVPYLASLRHTNSGLEKFGQWCRCWDEQRSQDAGASLVIEPPDKYTSTDFASGTYYRLRGQLDVPTERFISYPSCESDQDGEPVYGWAGWNHLQRAQALGSLYLVRKDGEGWTKERLTPMLAGVLELIPWVKQWHNEPSVEYGGQRMGDYFEQFVDGECRQHGLTHDDLRAWRPPKKARVKAKAAKAPVSSINARGDDEPQGKSATPKQPRPRKTKAKPAGSTEVES